MVPPRWRHPSPVAVIASCWLIVCWCYRLLLLSLCRDGGAEPGERRPEAERAAYLAEQLRVRRRRGERPVHLVQRHVGGGLDDRRGDVEVVARRLQLLAGSR